MLKFLTKGQVDDGNLPPLEEDLKKSLADLRRMGQIIVKIWHAKGLIGGKIDPKNLSSSLSPYVKLTMPGK
jgi:hypothetical protein